MDVFESFAVEPLRVYDSDLETVYQNLLAYVKRNTPPRVFTIIDETPNREIRTRYKEKYRNEYKTVVRAYQLINFTLEQRPSYVQINIEFSIDPDHEYKHYEKNRVRNDWPYIVEKIGKSIRADIDDVQRRIHPREKLESELSLTWQALVVYIILVSPFYYFEVEAIYPTTQLIFIFLAAILAVFYWQRIHLLRRLYPKKSRMIR